MNSLQVTLDGFEGVQHAMAADLTLVDSADHRDVAAAVDGVLKIQLVNVAEVSLSRLVRPLTVFSAMSYICGQELAPTLLALKYPPGTNT